MEGGPYDARLSSKHAPKLIRPILRWVIAIVIFGLWAHSLALSAAYFVQVPGPVRGYDILFLGWMGIASLQPAWLANIGLFFALPIFLHEGRPGGCLLIGSGVAMGVCAVAALFWDSWPQGSSYGVSIVWGPGFYFWVSAVAGMAIAALWRAAAHLKAFGADML